VDGGGSDNLRILAQTLKNSGKGRITLRGESMHPTLHDGWKLHVRSLGAESLCVGDIGVFIHGDVLTIHRLIWRKQLDGKTWLIFQGDNNAVREMVAPDSVLGRVEAAEVERVDGRESLPFRVGRDSRAWFYRSLFRVNQVVSGILPGASVPLEGESAGFVYRVSRALFRMLEPLFSPRPRR
jgi:hypothetical protein